jgi:dipeptidyl aminopeptidase/acylaminoacyl peptidase
MEVAGMHYSCGTPKTRSIVNSAFFCLLLILLPLASAGGDVSHWTTNNDQLILQDVPAIPATLVDRLNQYQSVRSAAFLDWTRDSKSIYIRTRFGDISQVHKVHAAGGARVQMTWFREPVGQVSRRDKADELALTMDEGGAERDQIFLFDPKTASTSRVSNSESRNRLLVWSPNGRSLAFQSTRRNGGSNDIWMMDPDRPGSAELLLEAPAGSWLGPADFSRDGKYLLVQQALTVSDSRIYVLDLRNRELQLLAGSPEYPTANRAVCFDRTGKGFYYISNARGRAAELAWKSLDPAVPATHLTAGIPWDVTEFAISDNGKRGAFITNEEGMSRLYLFDTRTRQYTQVGKIPVGIISNIKFSPDNRQLGMTLNTAQTPSDVYVLNLGSSPKKSKSLVRWTFSEVGGLDTRSFVEPELVRYPTFDLQGEEQRTVPAFVYRPKTAGPHPVVIYVHGGPESQYRPMFNSTIQMWVAELGTAVIAPNIRGSSGYDIEYLSLDDGDKREDAVKDIGALLDWIRIQPELDASRVAIYGASYGGYIVLASAVRYSDRLKAGIDVVGISNFVTFLENTEDYRRDLRRQEYGDEREPEMRSFFEQISPLNHVDRIDVPLLVVQGRNDPRVPASESEQIVQAMRERDRPVWYIEALNEGHGYSRKENVDVYEQATILFLQQYLVQ